MKLITAVIFLGINTVIIASTMVFGAFSARFMKPLATETGAGEEFLRSAARTAGTSAGKKGKCQEEGRSGGSSAALLYNTSKSIASSTPPALPFFPALVPAVLAAFLRNSSPAPVSVANGFAMLGPEFHARGCLVFFVEIPGPAISGLFNRGGGILNIKMTSLRGSLIFPDLPFLGVWNFLGLF